MATVQEEELAKLPLRGIVAYAAQVACPCSELLARQFPSADAGEILEAARRFTSQWDVEVTDSVKVLRAAARIGEATGESSAFTRVGTARLALQAVAMAVYAAVSAVEDPDQADRYKRMTAHEAGRAATYAESFYESEADEIRCNCRCDYQTLLQYFGETDDVILGAPFDLDIFDS